MKIKVNRNILWAEIFIKKLASAGVKFACISPGSRSTPLTYAAAANKNITSYVHIDERSGAFFASGLARKSGTPVLLICTSGTAAAEFYPAVIEAFQQKIPLIVCTADRPTGAFLKGTNQTINQNNLYRNHILWFADAGLPDINHPEHIIKLASRAITQSTFFKGPVHINFPFDKPFEPYSYTDEINEVYNLDDYPIEKGSYLAEVSEDVLQRITSEVIKNTEGLITVGPSDFPTSFRTAVLKLSELTGYPVLADGASQLRAGEAAPDIFVNYDAVFRNGYYNNNKPSVIIHFGRTMTSKGFEDFIMHYNGLKFLINKHDEVFDPSGKYTELIPMDEEIFLNKLIGKLNGAGFSRKLSDWLVSARKAETAVCTLKEQFIFNSPFPDESRIIPEILNLIPEKSNIMISNSMPIRDFDYFSGLSNKKITVYHNRGASGIDGIISTALGIAAEGGLTVLITGDLAFYHDMNGLLAGKNNNIQLIIILINNNGGGIFRALPVSEYPDIFEKYFTTPHNLNFGIFVKGYGGYYKEIKSWDDLKQSFNEAITNKGLSVLEIKTDADESFRRRIEFWNMTKELLDDNSTV